MRYTEYVENLGSEHSIQYMFLSTLKEHIEQYESENFAAEIIETEISIGIYIFDLRWVDSYFEFLVNNPDINDIPLILKLDATIFYMEHQSVSTYDTVYIYCEANRQPFSRIHIDDPESVEQLRLEFMLELDEICK